MPRHAARHLLRLAALLLPCAGAFAQPPAHLATPHPLGSHLDAAERDSLLHEHNRVRARVGVVPLRWSPQLAASAQRWADHLAGAGSCRLQHSQASGYGENLYMGSAAQYGVRDAARAWAREKKLYRGGPLRADSWAPSGHFTQMVWHDTRHLGCGISECDGMRLVVCHYEPKGNYLGRVPY